VSLSDTWPGAWLHAGPPITTSQARVRAGRRISPARRERSPRAANATVTVDLTGGRQRGTPASAPTRRPRHRRPPTRHGEQHGALTRPRGDIGDLSVTRAKTRRDGTAGDGTTHTYTITVANAGPVGRAGGEPERHLAGRLHGRAPSTPSQGTCTARRISPARSERSRGQAKRRCR
jgi:hypothetical protein